MSILDETLDVTVDPSSKRITLREDEIDPRLKLLSHSSRLTLNSCPKKYQLYRLKATREAYDDMTKITFAYGNAVGTGIQSFLEGKTEQQCLIDTVMAWDTDFLAVDKKRKKSIPEAIFAVQRFSVIRSALLEGYELVYWEGKPAVELSFSIALPNGFFYRGYIDAVLKHKDTGEVIVLENKTSSATPNSAAYKNSGQALGYSVILDKVFPGLSSYKVVYCVYSTAKKDYVTFEFNKTSLHRALWLQELIMDTDIISYYEAQGVYPTRGESCFSFFRECEYMGTCGLDVARLTAPLTSKVLEEIEESEKEYDFHLDFYDLVESQLDKEIGGKDT